MLYTFTDAQLTTLLTQTIELYDEYQDMHGKDRPGARWRAVDDTIDGLNAERDLASRGEVAKPSQVLDGWQCPACGAAVVVAGEVTCPHCQRTIDFTVRG